MIYLIQDYWIDQIIVWLDLVTSCNWYSCGASSQLEVDCRQNTFKLIVQNIQGYYINTNLNATMNIDERKKKSIFIYKTLINQMTKTDINIDECYNS